ncbi:unnamed protein product [Didymodactylos carnosus]|uniref:glucan endo-1,3-beta-D-glucosidase n=1 Tax=Didymodactylos carnosus TaxID=1234261 RepID=A0A813UQ71_9BILA|nr:unnamed protein product [Didymodactylos carnosus]CAF0830834.1 unnamed protein product [Didymodactylos carnosus]CAF3600537.1 unnamed protein product [Didymodactylos carnosus]CAF3617894.1 unnamed protein product [Didymodactylos carnosus]
MKMLCSLSIILFGCFYYVCPIDVLQPISTSAPGSLYPRITHPRQPKRLNLANKEQPLHTNKYFGNAYMESGKNPIFSHPYVLLANFDSPYGVSISNSEEWSFGPQIDSTRVKYFINTIHKTLQVSATEFTGQNFEITSFDEPGFSFTMKLFQSSSTITMPIVRGMTYVTFEYANATPKITTVHAILNVNGQSSGQVTCDRFEIALNNGQIWILYSLNGEITLNINGNELVGTSKVTSVLRVVKKQSDSTANQVLDAHSTVYPTGCTLSADVTGTKGTMTFNWILKGDTSKTLLHFTFPHHRPVISNATPTGVRAQSSTKGEMIGYIGNAWTLTETLSTMGFLAPRDPATQYNDHIRAQLKVDVINEANIAQGDYYFSGKEYHKYALLCLLANYYNEQTLKTQCIQTLQTKFNILLEGKNSNALRYDTTYKGAVSSAGLGPLQELADFGNSYYNDHHYHWGYFINTAAIIAELDPTYIPKMKDWIEILLRDANNPSPKDTNFPQFRYFDWFSGHSWSQGLFESADGKDQESTSEEVNFHYGLALWGKATKTPQLEGLGRLMLATAKRAIQTYFLMSDDNTALPKQFIKNKVTGIFFENKADYATWFGANPEFIHGIQMIPATPITEEVRLPKFVEEEWNQILSKVVGNAVEGWKSLLYMNYAIINRGEGFAQLLKVPLDNGVSRTWALYWAATRPNSNDGTLPPVTDPTTTPSVTGTTTGTTSGNECTLPLNKPCKSLAAPGDINNGLGMFYDVNCQQGGVGCNHIQHLCRLCAKDPAVYNKPYIPCPACV